MLPFLPFLLTFSSTLVSLSIQVPRAYWPILSHSAGVIMLEVIVDSPIPTIPWTLGMAHLAILVNTTLYKQVYFFSLILPCKYMIIATCD